MEFQGKRIKIAPKECLNKELEVAVKEASEALKRGGIVLYPTDTLYGLGVDIGDEKALNKLCILKVGSSNKRVNSIVADLQMAGKYVVVGEEAQKLFDAFLPGPLAIILKSKDGGEIKEDNFGIRIPNSKFCIELAKAFGKPYTSTSANISGLKPELSVDAILAQLGERAHLIDVVVDAGKLPESAPSTVVDVSGGEIKVLREGAISKDRIKEILT